MLQKIARIRLLPFLWLFVITVLFLLPGSALPKSEMIIPHFDKYVHFGFFAVLLFLWRFQFSAALRVSVLLLVMAFVYGMGIEVIQHYLIANRSFDMGDVWADMAGAVAGVLAWVYIKK
ncbi:MAG: VanZ family protein [Chitinophagaceae bacterium]|nr:MAG: VanZ family protein [Chitinophagaceae bacterium]